MSTVKLPEAQWQKIFEFLQPHEGIHLGKESACRPFVEAVLWILRSGAPWRLLPAEQGRWNSVYRRFRIAGFGGFLGRKSDAHPGPKAIWEGMQQVRAFVIALEAHKIAYFQNK